MSELTNERSYSEFYDNEANSDVQLHFGDSKVIKAHKTILAFQSKYFSSLFAKDSMFAEGNKDKIVLQDDDPDALEVVMKWCYNIPYKPSEAIRNPLIDQIEVHRCADKYGLEISIALLRNITEALETADISTLSEVIIHVHNSDFPQAITDIVEQRRDEKILELLSDESFAGDFMTNIPMAAEVFRNNPALLNEKLEPIEPTFRQVVVANDGEFVFDMLVQQIARNQEKNLPGTDPYLPLLLADTNFQEFLKNNKELCMQILLTSARELVAPITDGVERLRNGKELTKGGTRSFCQGGHYFYDRDICPRKNCGFSPIWTQRVWYEKHDG